MGGPPMLTTVEMVRFYIPYVEAELMKGFGIQEEIGKMVSDEEITSLIWVCSHKFDSRTGNTFTRRTVRHRVDGGDNFELTLPHYPIKELYFVKVYIGTSGLMWEFKPHNIIYSDKGENFSPDYTSSRELFVNRLTGRIVVPVFWQYAQPDLTAYIPWASYGGVLTYLGYARRFISGSLNIEYYGVFGYHVHDDEEILRPPLDIQNCVAKMVCLELATVAATAVGGLASWSMGERSESYAGGHKFGFLFDRWKEEIDLVCQRYFRWDAYVDTHS